MVGIAKRTRSWSKSCTYCNLVFYIGGAVLLASVLWTSFFRTKEYPPEEYAKYNNLEEKENENPEKVSFFTLIKKCTKRHETIGCYTVFS